MKPCLNYIFFTKTKTFDYSTIKIPMEEKELSLKTNFFN